MHLSVNEKVKSKKLSVNNNCESKEVYKTRIVLSKNVHNGCIFNWRADWARLQGKTYAKVVKANNDLCSQGQIWAGKTVAKKVWATKKFTPKHSKAPVSSPALENNVNKLQIKSKKVANLTSPKIAQEKSRPGDIFNCYTKNRFQPHDPLVDSPENDITMAINPVANQSCKTETYLKTQSTTDKAPNKPIIESSVKKLVKIIVKILVTSVKNHENCALKAIRPTISMIWHCK